VEAAPRVLGWDAAGVVEQVGSAVTLFKPGDRVFYAGDITRPGSNSAFQLVDERIVGHAPKSLSFAQAAALPLTAITAWEALFDRLKVPTPPHAQPRRSILLIGGAGGVGSIAIQLAAKVAGLKVIATASRPESAAWCKELGADAVVNHHGNLVEEVRKAGYTHVDYVLIMNNTDQHMPAACELVAPQGGICTIVENAKPVDVVPLKSKSAAFMWEFMFTRAMFTTPDMIEQHNLLNEIARLIDAGVIRTTVSEVLKPINAANLRAAHAKLEAGNAIGKVVLEGF
jgi:zinc-binding alcohol dehydrogenase family protein